MDIKYFLLSWRPIVWNTNTSGQIRNPFRRHLYNRSRSLSRIVKNKKNHAIWIFHLSRRWSLSSLVQPQGSWLLSPSRMMHQDKLKEFIRASLVWWQFLSWGASPGWPQNLIWPPVSPFNLVNFKVSPHLDNERIQEGFIFGLQLQRGAVWTLIHRWSCPDISSVTPLMTNDLRESCGVSSLLFNLPEHEKWHSRSHNVLSFSVTSGKRSTCWCGCSFGSWTPYVDVWVFSPWATPSTRRSAFDQKPDS